jgi:Tfp pilus assembly protein PilF
MNRPIAVISVTMWFALLSGCASMGESSDAPVSAEATPSFYEGGEPEVVFATEFPIESAEEAIARGDQALGNRDMDLALYMYVRAYDIDKQNVYALQRIGEIHDARGNARLASMAFNAALRYEPANASVLQSLGLIYLQAKRHDEAESLLQRAVAENPSLWRSHSGIGILADMRGEHQQAIESHNAALAVNPDDASLLNNRGYSQYLAGAYTEAAEDFTAAGTAGAERAWLNLGLVRARQKRYPEAVQIMSRAVEQEVAFNDVGYIAMRQGDLGVAEVYFQKAIEVAPRFFEEAQRNLDELRVRNLAQPKVKYVDSESG